MAKVPERVAATKLGLSQSIIVGARLRVSFRQLMKTRKPRREAFQEAFGGGSANWILGEPAHVLNFHSKFQPTAGRRLSILTPIGREIGRSP